MSIARFAVGSKATFAKSLTRVVSAQKPYTSSISIQNGVNQNRQLSSTSQLFENVATQSASQKSNKTSSSSSKIAKDPNNKQAIRRAYGRELADFRELLTLTNQQSSGGSSNNNNHSKNEKLSDIKEAMGIYNRLREVQPFTLVDIATLIQGIHSSSRTNMKSLTYVISDLRSEQIARHSRELLQYLEVIASDIRNSTTETNMFGLMQLFTCYGTMKNPKRGYELWKQFVEDESTSEAAKKLARSPKVVGAVIDLMVADSRPIEEIEQVYNSCRETSSDINLEHTLARAYIFYNHTTEALRLFSNIVREYPNEDYYLSRIHETFIGDCTNLDIAKAFYNEAMQKQTPYVVSCHPSAAHRLMERSWASNKDVDELFQLWQLYLTNVAPSMRERMFNILSYSLLTRFFEANPKMDPSSYEYLKRIISTYSELRPTMSAIFLNTLLTRASQWGNKDVTLGIIDTFDAYSIVKKNDSYRVILNSLYNIEVDRDYIAKLWQERIALTAVNAGREKLEIYDWGSLAKACMRTEELNGLFKELYMGSPFEMHPGEVKKLVSFLGRPYAGTNYAADIVKSVTA